MQSRNYAFAVFRKLALQDFRKPPRNISAHMRWSWPTTRLVHQYVNRPTKPIHPPNPTHPPEKQAYEMTFTCKPCNTRSTHRISKQGYHFGSVLITCPECKNRHIISDHLGIFLDKAATIEDLLREKGQLIKKGTLSEDGDLEFWNDGTTTKRAKVDDSQEGVV